MKGNWSKAIATVSEQQWPQKKLAHNGAEKAAKIVNKILKKSGRKKMLAV